MKYIALVYMFNPGVQLFNWFFKKLECILGVQLIDSNLQIKISNIGIARMETKNDYFNPQTSNEGNEPAQTLIHVRWMSPESLLEANYTMVSSL